ncbi:MAG: S9 family peptidase [Alphaproteobacteria bacterium]|nr:S9 family peptidase [Alphaproteobacteria bacterium]
MGGRNWTGLKRMAFGRNRPGASQRAQGLEGGARFSIFAESTKTHRALATGLVSLAALAAGIGAGATVQAAPDPAPASAPPASLKAILGYPFQTNLVAAPKADVIAWVEVVRGVRNIWAARGPDYKPVEITHETADDGQELQDLVLSADGARVFWVRGGDHDANWPAEGGLAPDPDKSPVQPKLEIWTAPTDGARAPVKLADGDAPAVSATGRLAFEKDHQIWTASTDGKGEAHRLFFDRGEDGEIAWSPSGDALAFVSNRGDHAFVGVYRDDATPLLYLSPSTDKDAMPRWSPDGAKIAFIRTEGDGGPPKPILTETPEPWSIHVADARDGKGETVWASGAGPRDSYPDVAGGANLHWAAGDRLVFLSERDGWEHLYEIPAAGGAQTLLTPGDFMVEHVDFSPDGSQVIYDANTGAAPHDLERRHIFAVPVAGGAPVALTSGEGLEYEPAALSHAVAFVEAGPRDPTRIALVRHGQQGRQTLSTGSGADYPTASLVTPRAVTFTSSDGLTIHGDLFEASGGAARKPAVIFVHGGPPRQMLLGWSYMDYYSNAYAVNEYLATHGFVVLSVNYRLGIGYGRDFQHPAHAGFRGASEYLDVQAGAKFLQALPEVDPQRIGIWGGSYGGYLTALALARNSDVFKAGVDFHGVHDWPDEMNKYMGGPPKRYEQGDYFAARDVAWKASPVADIATWTSPVLLIQGDDDRNVMFHQTVDLARRLQEKGVSFEELVIPNEIHGFLRYQSWLEADTATADYLTRKLGATP